MGECFKSVSRFRWESECHLHIYSELEYFIVQKPELRARNDFARGTGMAGKTDAEPGRLPVSGAVYPRPYMKIS